MSERPLLASTTSGGSFPLNASRRVVLRSSKDRDTRLILMFGYFASNSLISWAIWAAWPPRTSWSQTSRVTAPILAASVWTADADAGGLVLGEVEDPGAHAATEAIPNALATNRIRGERIMWCSFVPGETCGGVCRRSGSWCLVHVCPTGDGGRGTADRADGNGGDNLLEEGVPAFQ